MAKIGKTIDAVDRKVADMSAEKFDLAEYEIATTVFQYIAQQREKAHDRACSSEAYDPAYAGKHLL